MYDTGHHSCCADKGSERGGPPLRPHTALQNLPTGLTVDSNGEISGTPGILQTTANSKHHKHNRNWRLGSAASTTAAVNITIGPKALSDVSGFSISGSGDVIALTGGSVTATVAGGLTHTSDYTLSIDKGGSSVCGSYH